MRVQFHAKENVAGHYSVKLEERTGTPAQQSLPEFIDGLIPDQYDQIMHTAQCLSK